MDTTNLNAVIQVTRMVECKYWLYHDSEIQSMSSFRCNDYKLRQTAACMSKSLTVFAKDCRRNNNERKIHSK